MALHLIKLCVGAESIEDLEEWIAERIAERRKRGERQLSLHVTRMAPKRGAELLDGGSLYWVIRGQVAARQELKDIETFMDADGIGRCRLWMQPQVTPVLPRPYRPFQGWRYLAAKDAPPDLRGRGDVADMPEALRRELSGLGLL
ncbi:DUF1489 family protein [Methylocapsa sp. S129]|uniref:DUF1489 family protein n=1 Tax=Methylocapsa sp. S129 TaxID=1641869 RepID=UPI00131DDF5A|nr:DUF1489 domain-containing protein [Methylocapsa sp. S129]